MLRSSVHSSAAVSLRPSWIVLLISLLSPWGAAQANIGTDEESSLQFAVSGHVLQFTAGGIHAAGSDHILHIGFVDSAKVSPKARGADGPAFTRVTYEELWPGIKLQYDAAAGGIAQSTWIIAPGGRPEQIRLDYDIPLEIGVDGSLVIPFATGRMSESKPVAWQDIEGQRRPVKVAFRLDPPGSQVGFELGAYDPAYPLVIDPVLQWNTFMGSAAFDEGRAIAVDSSGNTYVVGVSAGTWGAPIVAFAGGALDVFVAKFNSSGAMLWNTFMGSNGLDRGFGIALDDSGNIYVTGYSDATWGAPKNAYTGGWDAFAAKLDGNGNRVWNTFMGSASPDEGSGISVDAGGNVYVAGVSDATWGAPENAYAGNKEAFAAKLNSGGNFVWNTFMGSGPGDDWARAIKVDGAGKVVVAGTSNATWGTPLNPYAGDNEAFVVKLDNDGARQWSTFVGSADYDDGVAVTVDSIGEIYLVGSSDATWGTPVNGHAGDKEAYAAKLDSSGALLWNTFLGSSNLDWGRSVAIDAARNVYVGGTSLGSWGSPDNPYLGDTDAFGARLSTSGQREGHSFVGSVDYDEGYGIAVDSSGKFMYLTGLSIATWGTPVNGHAATGVSEDGFNAKLKTRSCTFFVINSQNGKSFAVCL